jgi:hypothetical protein
LKLKNENTGKDTELDLIRCQISANSLKIWHPAGTKNHSSNQWAYSRALKVLN